MPRMGYQMSGSTAWVFSLKAMVASAVVLSTLLMLHLSGPSILRFLTSGVPQLYGSLLSWLTPPYLYLVINGIIISIAASSLFQKPTPEYMPPTEEYVAKIAEDVQPESVASAEYGGEEVVGLEVVASAAAAEEAEGEEEFVISRSSWSPKRRESREKETATATECLAVTDKPLVSARFGHRKNVKPSPEGKALRVARPKQTLESTWRTITEGRPVPLARHLKKSDTWETHGRSASDEQSPVQLMRKSETFNDRAGQPAPVASSSPSPSSSSSKGRLRKEPSLGQDDLNRRVEAFIKKFNEEMRLQRQESFNHYMEMINRGSH